MNTKDLAASCPQPSLPARNIPELEMIAGRKVAIVFFDEHNARDAVIFAVYQ